MTPNERDYINLIEREYDYGTAQRMMTRMYNHTYHYFEERIDKELVAGCVVLEFGNNIFGISGMIVKKEYRNQGIGSRLMIHILEKYKGIFLLSSSGAKLFYKGFGFVQYKNTKCMIKIDGGAINW